MSRTVDELLQETLIHFHAASKYSQLPDADKGMALDAMTMRLFAGLETLTHVPDELADRLFADQWPKMKALRHRIAHGYGAINIRRVHKTVVEKVPGAIGAIQRELASN